jgi:hypothetical protein
MHSPARRLLPFVLVTLTLAVAGLATAASTDPQITIDPQDQSWADSIVLTRGDLGKGWVLDPTDPGDSSDDQASDDSTWCPEGIPDESDLTVTGGSASPGFTRKDSTSVSSFAYVWQTSEQAQADWDRTLAVMPAETNCLADVFDTAPTGAVKATITSKGAISFPAVAPRTAAYRIRIVFTSTTRVKKRKTPPFIVKFDVVLLGNGRSSAWLIVDSFGGKLSLAYERSLAAKMAARMTQDPAASSAP